MRAINKGKIFETITTVAQAHLICESLGTNALTINESLLEAETVLVESGILCVDSGIDAKKIKASINGGSNIIRESSIMSDGLEVQAKKLFLESTDIVADVANILIESGHIKNSTIAALEVNLEVTKGVDVDGLDIVAESAKIKWNWPTLDGLYRMLSSINLPARTTVDIRKVVKPDKWQLAKVRSLPIELLA